RDSITDALDGVNLMTSRANDQRQQIQAALDELPAGVAVLEEQRPQLVEMLRRVDERGEVGSDILMQSREGLIAGRRALRPGRRARSSWRCCAASTSSARWDRTS